MLHARIKGHFFRFIYIWVFIIIIATESESKMPLNKMELKRNETLFLILHATIKDSKLQPKTRVKLIKRLQISLRKSSHETEETDARHSLQCATYQLNGF